METILACTVINLTYSIVLSPKELKCGVDLCYPVCVFNCLFYQYVF